MLFVTSFPDKVTIVIISWPARIEYIYFIPVHVRRVLVELMNISCVLLSEMLEQFQMVL